MLPEVWQDFLTWDETLIPKLVTLLCFTASMTLAVLVPLTMSQDNEDKKDESTGISAGDSNTDGTPPGGVCKGDGESQQEGCEESGPRPGV